MVASCCTDEAVQLVLQGWEKTDSGRLQPEHGDSRLERRPTSHLINTGLISRLLLKSPQLAVQVDDLHDCNSQGRDSLRKHPTELLEERSAHFWLDLCLVSSSGLPSWRTAPPASPPAADSALKANERRMKN